MDNKSGRFIDYKKIIVFVDNIKRYILRNDLKIITRSIHHHTDDIKRFYLIARLHRFAVGEDTIGIRSLLNTVARSFLYPVGKKLVDTYHLLTFVGNKTEVLIKLRSFLIYLK